MNAFLAKIDPKKIANKKIVLQNEKPQDSKAGMSASSVEGSLTLTWAAWAR